VSRRVTVVPTAEEVASQALGLVLGAERRAIADHGAFRIALAGGNTPRRLYEMIAASELADFRNWHVFFGDERWVPLDDPGSNYRMARETLLDHVPIPKQQIHPVDTRAGSPAKAASLYAMTLARRLGTGPGEPPTLDLVLLGLGADGHTASLFPGMPEPGPGELVLTACQPSTKQWRVTMTPLLINAARSVVFLVIGPDKAEALRDVVEGQGDSPLPAARICPAAGELRFLVDTEAARLLHADH
jgi:6-phosphogluconolactonase